MIVTVTPNPSLDRTIELAELRRGEVHRALAGRLDPGGKGVNVARALTAAGVDTVAVLPSGRAPGGRLNGLLDAHAVQAVTVPINGATRTNITLVEADGTTTKINEVGPVLTPLEVAELAEQVVALARGATRTNITLVEADGTTTKINEVGPVLTPLEVAEQVVALARGATWVVSCGSLPAGTPDDFHGELVERCRRAGARVAVDTSGAPLRAAVAAGPDLLKPNHEELAELVGRSLLTLGEVIEAARELRAGGVGRVLVSLGAGGALLAEEGGEHHAATPPVAVRSTVGAGDATLAGFLAAGAVGPDALARAVAYGAAACRLPGSAMPGPQDIQLDEVRVLASPDTTLALTGAGAAA